jgi:MerR family transcriptional regulator, heat shock protein HspR
MLSSLKHRKNMKINRKKGFFSISAVAKIFSVHQQTIRLYEKQGLIVPKRSEGNTRLFSEEDIERLEEIIYLTHQMGINLAGVEMIMKLKKQMKKMQNQMNELFEDTHSQLDKESKAAEQTIKANAKELLKIKEDQLQLTGTQQQKDEHIVDVDKWEIEYEDD